VGEEPTTKEEIMGRRNWREDLLATAIIAADFGWNRNPFEIPGAVADWGHKFPTVPLVDDGETAAGRGSTAFDLVRRVNSGGLSRYDWLSLKTGSVESSGKIPTQYKLTTGNPETVAGIVSAVKAGAPYATCFFASRSKQERGCVIFADLAPAIRAHGIVGITDYPAGGFGRGKAPPFYVKWSSPRPSGVKRIEAMRRHGIPVDEKERVIDGVIHGPGYFRYPELTISLSALGVRRSSWYPGVHVNSIPLLLDRSEGFGGTSEVTWENMA
jgi:hypothetical protein